MRLFRLFGPFKGTSHHSDTPSEPSFVPAPPSPSSHLPHPVHLCSLLPHQAHQPLSLAPKAHMSPDSHHLLLHQVHLFHLCLSSSIATPVKSIATLASQLHHHLPFSHSPLTSVSRTHLLHFFLRLRLHYHSVRDTRGLPPHRTTAASPLERSVGAGGSTADMAGSATGASGSGQLRQALARCPFSPQLKHLRAEEVANRV